MFMSTPAQIKKLEKSLREYKKRFLTGKNHDLDESSTRLMINNFLEDVLGYVAFEEIKTEYRIKNQFADYVIQLNKKQRIIVEVKSIKSDLNKRHLNQALGYAVNEGINWILLTNGRAFSLYRVLFNQPVETKKIFSHDVLASRNLTNVSKNLVYLTKRSVSSGLLEKYWAKFDVIEPVSLSRFLYYKPVINTLRRLVKQKSKINFSEDEVLEALHKLIGEPIQAVKPKKVVTVKKKTKTQGCQKLIIFFTFKLVDLRIFLI